MFVPAIVEVIAPVNVRVTESPLARLVIVHTPLLYVPPVTLAVNPLGNGSFITIFVAVSGPLLVTFTVNVPVCPTFNLLELAVFVITTSAFLT